MDGIEEAVNRIDRQEVKEDLVQCLLIEDIEGGFPARRSQQRIFSGLPPLSCHYVQILQPVEEEVNTVFH